MFWKEILAMKRNPFLNKFMGVRKLLTKVQSLFEVDLTASKFIANGEVPSPCFSTILHMTLHLLLKWQCEVFSGCSDKLLDEVLTDTVILDIEEPRCFANISNFLSCFELLFLVGITGDKRGDVDDGNGLEIKAVKSVVFHDEVKMISLGDWQT